MLYLHLFTWASRHSLITSSSRNPWYSWLTWLSSGSWGSFRPPLHNGPTWRPRRSCMASFSLFPLCSSLSRNSQRTLVHNKCVNFFFLLVSIIKRAQIRLTIWFFFSTSTSTKVAVWKRIISPQNSCCCLHLNQVVLSVLVHPGFPSLLSVLVSPCPGTALDWTPVQRTEKWNQWQSCQNSQWQPINLNSLSPGLHLTVRPNFQQLKSH